MHGIDRPWLQPLPAAHTRRARSFPGTDASDVDSNRRSGSSLKERYVGRLVLVGGLDASELLPRGTVDEVREATQRALDIGMAGSGNVLGSTTELSNAIPPENILAMWQTAQEYSG